MNMLSEMTLNPNFDFDMTAEQLETFLFQAPARQEQKVCASPARDVVSASELEAANAAYAKMLEDFMSESVMKVA